MVLSDASDQAILKELGRRIARCRLNQNRTQAALAAEAGVSKPTIHRMESGESTQLTNLLRVLRALKLAGNLDALIPEPEISPVQKLKLLGKARHRASSRSNQKKDRGNWSWGNEK